jgi:hypothetical protein
MRLGFVVLCLTLASIAGTLSTYFLGHGKVLGLVQAFDLDKEGNIPTWYAASTLLVCSILLATIAQAKKTQGALYTLYWRVLALIFLCLSLDEAAEIHELWGPLLRSELDVKGFLYFAWVIPGGAFALIVFLFYLRFLAALPPRTRYLFLIAGIVYVGGAIGMETVGASVFFYSGLEHSFMFAMMTTIEEFLEMLGILVFIYALLSYMRSQRVQVLF